MTRGGCALAVALACAGRASGQEAPAAELRGSVVTVAGERVPHALVQLRPGFGERFTDQRGVFAFGPLPAGTYRLRVRQVGFEPFDTSLALGAERLAIRVALRPLAIELSALTVTAAPSCARALPVATAGGSALATLVGQARENAKRFAVLADSYPFRYGMERTFVAYDAAGSVVWSAQDTADYGSSGAVRYRPGSVVQWGPGPEGRVARVLNLPTLPDLADSVFTATHCFYYGGIAEADGRPLVWMKFLAAETLPRSDIEGEVGLDPRTYQIRRATVRLTHPGRAVPGLQSASSTMWFGELAPNIVVPIRVEGEQVPDLQRRMSGGVARRSDDQRLISVRFLRALPDSTSAPH